MTSETVIQKAKKIKLLLLDVDGVLSDGKIYFNDQGVEHKAFNTLDGHGIKMLRRSGVEVGIITGRSSHIVEKRAQDLGIQFLIQGREDKYSALCELLKSFPCELDEIAFMGDDYPDLTVMTKVGLALTVANALPVMVERSHWQSTRAGGEGAVREACDFIMQAQGSFDTALAQYIS
ncbi:HAD-IIIA family hydrolase [Teredinibacter sp. KSP-S5-2]|uniref:KdsC family phosphatase n=1 Tax=Teredinibacter sp. KSP-S5-2 TaxID=3034506 RepID=UPI0029343E6E|nr:HAD-IIIA family hydrolase [Teredinibacter sp. KSP-S5-2]WNO09590.1 HAD-IIIA family hydrolase [Teredinibacter sp. KSP-S5-2]